MLKIITGNSINLEKWRKLQEQSENLSPFHSEEFHDFLNLSSTQKAVVIAVSEGDKIHALAVVCLIK